MNMYAVTKSEKLNQQRSKLDTRLDVGHNSKLWTLELICANAKRWL